jgi:hypothetical protein
MRLVILILVAGLCGAMLVGCGSDKPAISQEVYKQRAEEQKKQFGIPDNPKEMVLQKQQQMQKDGKLNPKAGQMQGPGSPSNP